MIESHHRLAARYVYTVHPVRDGNRICPVEVAFLGEDEARGYATTRSGDREISAAVITRFTLGELGSRLLICWFEMGVRHSLGDAPSTGPLGFWPTGAEIRP